MKSLKQITTDMLRDTRTWPQVTHLCMKQGSPLGGKGRCGIVLAHGYGTGRVVVRNYPDDLGAAMYGGPFVEEFASVDALLAAGWVVD